MWTNLAVEKVSGSTGRESRSPRSRPNDSLYGLLAVFGGMTRLGSSKSQAPKKFQAPNLNAPPGMDTTSLGPWFGA